jgi:hypothetical protein
MVPHVDLILHYENAIVRLRENEAWDDCTTSHSLYVLVTNSKEIEIAVVKAFSPSNFYILQEEINKIEGIKVL